MKAATQKDFYLKSRKAELTCPKFYPCPEISFSKFKYPACFAAESELNNEKCYEFLRCLVPLVNWIFPIWMHLICKEFKSELSYYGVSKVHSHFILSYIIAVIVNIILCLASSIIHFSTLNQKCKKIPSNPSF